MKGFGIVSNDIIRNPELTLREKGMYAHLSTYADASTGTLTVSINRIASECGIAHSTAKRILKKLVEKGVVKREYRSRHETHLTTLLH